MPELRNLNYFILPDAEIVQFNNKPNIQRYIDDVNAVRLENEKVQGNSLLYIQNNFKGSSLHVHINLICYCRTEIGIEIFPTSLLLLYLKRNLLYCNI